MGLGAASALVALSETWKYVEGADLPTGLSLTVIMVAGGLSALVGWMTLTGSILAMYKLKGGVKNIWQMDKDSNLGSIMAKWGQGVVDYYSIWTNLLWN